MKRQVWKVARAWILTLSVLVSLLSGLGEMPEAKAASEMGVTYAVHIQTFGDQQGWVSNGDTAGTVGRAKRLEEIRIKLTGTEYDGSVRYKTHVQSYGWQNWSSNGEKSGSRGQAKRLEAIEIELTGEVAYYYNITYQVHVQSYGWQDWVSNGEMAGTSGQAKRLEGIRIRLTPKTTITEMGVTYRTHVQTFGWQDWVSNGEKSGTTGKSKRLEAIEIKLTGNMLSGGISYKTHVQSYGWETTAVSNGALSGTSGQAKRLEAIQIELYGDVAEWYDVYYRVHAQSYGWLGWAKNGETAGTSGLAKRLEAIEIKLVPFWEDFDEYENSGTSYVEGTTYSQQAQEILTLCNQQRSAKGLSSLSLDPELTKAANIRAKEIAEYFDHTRPDGRSCFTVLGDIGYSYRAVGENIAAGQTSSAEVMEDWMNSSGHRANILSSNYNKLGVGYYVDTTKPYRYYWVQLFSN